MSDLIDRQAAIDAIENAFDRETILNRFVRKIAISAVRLLPSEQPEQKIEELLPDGTLHLSTDADLSKVGRVLVSQNGTHYGGLYYADGEPKRGKYVRPDNQITVCPMCPDCPDNCPLEAEKKYVQQKPRWVSVEERLPENRDWVLGIFQECDTGWINPIPFVCDYVGRETPITTSDFWILHGINEPDSYYQGLKCVAWMPLPKPYERSEDERPYRQASGD